MIKKKVNKKNADCLPENQANKLLNQIITDSQSKRYHTVTSSINGSDHSKQNYFRYAAIVCCVLLLLMFFIPGTLTPAPISRVSSSPMENSGSATISFQVNSLVPPRSISALLNDKPVKVEQESYQGYSVNVQENGYLLLQVESITGKTSSQNLLINNLDDTAPKIVRHENSGSSVIIYVTDDDTGVDFAKIRAYNPDTSEQVLPTSFNEEEGYVVFNYPQSAVYIEIPDKAENKITYVLKPIKSKQ